MTRDELEYVVNDYAIDYPGKGVTWSAVTAALDKYTREVQAAAWAEGKEAEQEAQFLDGGYGNVQHAENPYEKEVDHG